MYIYILYNQGGKTMKKLLCLFLCAVMLFGLCATAFASPSEEYETITGEYKYLASLNFLSGKDPSYHFTYSDEYFTHSGYEYNHDLAKMTMDMIQSLGVTVEGDWSVANKNFIDLMSKCGFENIDANYYSTHEPTGDSIGVSMGEKKIVDDGQEYTLLAVGVRGHGYGNEWASNFTLGYSGDHQGFAEARDQALDYVKEYIAKYDVTGHVKIWLTGYSRSAITANMMGGKIDQGFDFGNGVLFDLDDLYCYTFEAPQGTADEACHDSVYWNIHNIVNANDLVTVVSFTKWGHSRFGIDYYLPCRQNDGNYYYALKPQADAIIGTMDTMNIGGMPFDLIDAFHYISLDPATAIEKSDVTQKEFFDEAIDAITACLAPTRGEYVDNAQADLREFSMTLLGSRTDHLVDALAIFGQKFLELENLKALINSLTIKGMIAEGTLVDVTIDLFMESMVEAGAAGYDGDQLRAMLNNLVPKLLVMLKEYPDTTLTLVGNILNILCAHCPEIGRAWLEVTPAAFFEAQAPVGFFEDVPSGAYYYDAVKWAYSEGVVSGFTATSFAPDAACTRGQAATFLWRAAGCPEPSTAKCPFVDVSSSSPYYKAILWAAEKGITNGKDATHFCPNDKCTRAQIVTFLYRYEGSPIVLGICPFADVSLFSPYRNAITWAAYSGVAYGKDAIHFAPNDICTRAQIVCFLYRDLV